MSDVTLIQDACDAIDLFGEDELELLCEQLS